MGSFRVKEKAPLDHILDKASQMKFSEGKTLTKEQLRTLEDDQDKDEDSCADIASPPVQELYRTPVDMVSVRRSFRMLFEITDPGRRERILKTLNSVLCNLLECLPLDIQCTMSKQKVENIFTACIVILDIFCLGESEWNCQILD